MRALLIVIAITAACGSSAALDAPPSCDQLSDLAWKRVQTLDTSCRTVDDCVFVGGVPSCRCGPTFAGGSLLSKTGAADAELQQLLAQFTSRCGACGDGNTCLCIDDRETLVCEAGRCTYTSASCVRSAPDAGP
jgi:hypothetical protein